MTTRTLWKSLLLGTLVLLGTPRDSMIMSESNNQTSTAEQGGEVVTLGGGCFWCIEAIFDESRGVERVESGYSGGSVANPTYRQVCTGATGHAEVIQITFNPKVISLKDILEIFFT